MPLLPRLAVVVLFAVASALPAAAQGGAPPVDPGVRPVTRTVAITNARVVQAPGRVLDRATVVVRDGRIAAVGPQATVPFDADVIEGDSLVVYAGFIDALGHAALDVPAADAQARVPIPDAPPRDRAGILPDRRAVTLLDPASGSVEALRRAGFTVAHVAPSSGMLPGQGAVVLLAGETPEAMTLRPVGGLVARWDGAAGVRPSTPMAVAATFRQLFRRAEEAAEHERRYAANPAGARRPAFDPVSDALQAARRGEQDVFFVVRDVNEAQRALRLGEALGLRVVLTGVTEAPLLVERLRRASRPVVLPLALPETVETDTSGVSLEPDELLAAHLAGEVFRTERRIESWRDVPDEARPLQERRRAAVLRAERNARALHEARVPFAFASLDAPAAQIRPTLRRLVAAGLPADAALAALTTTPAALLGLDRQLGTVEAGRIANLVVTDGDYFADDTHVRYVFVDGQRFEVDGEGDAPAEDPEAEVQAAGRWAFSLDTPEGTMTGAFRIERDGDTLAGSIDFTGRGTLQLRNVTLQGNRLSFTIVGTPYGNADVSGLIAEDAFTGSLSLAGMGSVPFNATRRPDGSMSR